MSLLQEVYANVIEGQNVGVFPELNVDTLETCSLVVSCDASVNAPLYVQGGVVLTEAGLTFPDGTTQSTATLVGPQGETGPQGPQGPPGAVASWWTLLPGANTVSFTVAGNGTYVLWVRGNIPNGIVSWNATVSVSNTNVPAIGTQYGWYYKQGNELVLTALPTNIVGTAGAISEDNPIVGNVGTTFSFGITNNTAENQTVYYGSLQANAL